MQTALKHLSKEDLLAMVSDRDWALAERNEKIITLSHETSKKDEEIGYLKSQLAMYRQMQFGQKRERFEGDPNQTALPFEAASVEVVEQQEETKQKIEYIRKRPNHHGRAKLPEHLPVEEVEIHPEGDLSDMVCIGKEITEELECEPEKFYIKRYIRYKYAAKNGEGVKIGGLPERVIDKGIPRAGLLAMILTDKYMCKLPLKLQHLKFEKRL
jgi:transposase